MARKPTPLTDAEKIAQEFRDFTYIVSHDLNAPLRSMVQFSQLLKAEQLDALSEDGKEYLSFIIGSGERLQSMLLGLLDYSRLNTMGKPLAKLDCNTLLSDCQVVLKDKIKSAKATMDIAPLPTVMADSDQFLQLFLILLDNALTFQEAGKAPRALVSAKKEGKDWLFAVQDNGIGIEPEFYTRIFQPFQRLHIESEYPGIGMGLTLAKKIIERHGGRIWLESTPGQGSSFLFTIPDREAS